MRKSVIINGLGRIGRTLFKLFLDKSSFKVIGVNDIYNIDEFLYLLKYDSIYGVLNKDIKKIDENKFLVDNEEFYYYRSFDLSFLKNLSVDLFIECSGIYNKSSFFISFLDKNIKKVILSFVPLDDTPVFILGVNEREYKNQKIISNSSCTSNCLAPVLKLINNFSSILRVFATTIHSYTSEQKLLDSKISLSDIRRARASGINIIPFTSGVAKATQKVLPFLENKIKGYSLRVPVNDVTIIDTVIEFENSIDFNYFLDYLQRISSKYVYASSSPLVSQDVIGSSYSAIIDLSFVQIVDDNFIKLLLWQDNEFGYVSRLCELSSFIFSLE